MSVDKYNFQDKQQCNDDYVWVKVMQMFGINFYYVVGDKVQCNIFGNRKVEWYYYGGNKCWNRFSKILLVYVSKI